MISKAAIISYKTVNRKIFGQVQRLGSLRLISGARILNDGLRKIRTRWTKKLEKSGVPEAELSVNYIIEKVLGQDNELTLQKQGQIDDLCEQRLQRKPVQYIIGDWDFRDLTLLMKPPVFIPRPETEDLVDIIRSYHQLSSTNHLATSFRFLEVGCGSGAICLSLLSENQQASCVAIDINPEAVSLTKLNGKRNNLQDQLTVTQADIGSFNYTEKFDAIISNPPYIPSKDMIHLQPEVVSFEDRKALCGGEDGMDVIKYIFLAAPRLLKPNGSMWLEVDLSHPPKIREWIHQHPSFALQVNNVHDDFTQRVKLEQLPAGGVVFNKILLEMIEFSLAESNDNKSKGNQE